MATQDKACIYRQLSPTAVLLVFSFLGDSFLLSILMHPPVTTWYSKCCRWERAGGASNFGARDSGAAFLARRSEFCSLPLISPRPVEAATGEGKRGVPASSDPRRTSLRTPRTALETRRPCRASHELPPERHSPSSKGPTHTSPAGDGYSLSMSSMRLAVPGI